MADDSGLIVDNIIDIVTHFMLNTLSWNPTLHDAQAAIQSENFASFTPSDESEGDTSPLISGSSVELLIKMMLSRVDDIDLMFPLREKIAIPAGYPAPTELPPEYHTRVFVLEINDSNYAGYVYLTLRYILTESDDDGRYNAVLADRELYYGKPPESRLAEKQHGPADTQHGDENTPPIDRVMCIRCLSWPIQAAGWITRHRKFDWPDSATVDLVVTNGCDLVSVAHRLCKHDEWESKHQWRLSFSRTEIVLLNSWMPVKQIVYHMLRVFVKTSGLSEITDSSGTKMLSNYHIKTLMLWACELKPRCWWISHTNLVSICVELLHTLAVWLTDARCPHYFIRDSNLADSVLNAAVITEHLVPITESWLSMWFVNNYILKCAQLCPDNISRLFDDANTKVKLQAAVLAVVHWRQNTAIGDLWKVQCNADFYISAIAKKWCLTVQSCMHVRDTFAELNMQLYFFIAGIGLLHCAQKISKQDFNVEVMDIVSMFCGQFIGRRRYSREPGSVPLLSQAAKLMMDVANHSRSTVQLIEIELSKAYLHRMLRCKDSDRDSSYCLANVYLAVLYYITGQYQTAIDHCTLVTRLQDHSQYSLHVVQGKLLPKIDDEIDNVLGLAAFYQYVRAAALNQQQQIQKTCVFTAELFAHSLLTRCLAITNCNFFSQRLSVIGQRCYNVGDGPITSNGDLLLRKTNFHSRKRPLHSLSQCQGPTSTSNEQNTSELVDLLRQLAVKHLTAYRQLKAQQFAPIVTFVTTDFEAMYAYKRGDYQLCLQLSTQNVHTLLHARLMPQVYISPQFIQFFDDDIVALIALILIVHPQRGVVYFSGNVGISQLTLSLYLMTQCQLKLRHSATQLAQTLHYIGVAQERHLDPTHILELLVVRLAKRRALLHRNALARSKFHLPRNVTCDVFGSGT